MIIGVLGDTHVPGRVRSVPHLVFETFRERGVELILCSGDINTLSTLKELRKLAPLYAVRGEIDFLDLPENKIIGVDGIKLGITHGHEALDEMGREPAVVTAREMGVDVLVLGHTHKLRQEVLNGLLVLNPGSATGAWAAAGVVREPSFMVLDVSDRSVTVETYRIGGEGLEKGTEGHDL